AAARTGVALARAGLAQAVAVLAEADLVERPARQQHQADGDERERDDRRARHGEHDPGDDERRRSTDAHEPRHPLSEEVLCRYGRESRLTPSGGRTGSTPFYAIANVSVTLRVIVEGTRQV